MLSWRLGPVLALVIISTAATAALYKKQTKACMLTTSQHCDHSRHIGRRYY